MKTLNRISIILGVFLLISIPSRSYWEPINKGLTLQEPFVNFMKTIGDTIFAGISSSTEDKIGCGLIVSTDGGKTWENWGLNEYFITSLIKIDNNYFVGTNNYGVFFSSNNGKSWEKRNNGIQIAEYPDSYPWLNVRTLTSIGDKIYCGLWDKNQRGNLFVSTDLGLNWVKQKVETADEKIGVIFVENIDNIIYLGCRSDDMPDYFRYSKDTCKTFQKTKIMVGGLFTKMIKFKNKMFLVSRSPLIYFDNIDSAWQIKKPFEYEDPYIQDILLSITSLQDTILISTEAGKIYYSYDDGNTWKENSKFPFKLTNLNYLITSHNKYFVAPYYQSGIYTTNSINENWQNVEIEKINAKIISMEKCGKSILIGTEEFGLFQSTNYGDSWSEIQGFKNNKIFQIKAKNENTFYLCTSNGLYYTNNSGITFSIISDPLIGSIYSIDFSGETIVVGSENAGYYYSKNNGKDWFKIENSVYSFEGNSIRIFDNIWFTFSKYQGLFVSSDEGNSWESGNYGIYDNTAPNSRIYSDLIKFEGKLYLTTNNQDSYFSKSGLYVSEYNGFYWKMILSNLPSSYGKQYPRAQTIFGYDSTLFLSVLDAGIYISKDFGENWQPANEGLKNLKINKFLVNGKYIFAATDNGIYRMELSEFGLGVKDNVSKSIFEIFPNPTYDKLTLSQIPDGAVSYEIFDIFGNRVLPIEAIHELSLQIDVSTLYPGVYFLKLNNQKPVKFIKL